jgi:hypothetical protein
MPFNRAFFRICDGVTYSLKSNDLFRLSGNIEEIPPTPQ